MPIYEPFDWYQTPRYYDMVFDAGTAQEAGFLEAVAQRYAVPIAEPGGPLHILEPACGSGRLMAELALRGHYVAGIDLSDGMLAYARQRFADRQVPRGSAKLLQGPMQSFDLHKHSRGRGYDLAHILVSSYKYLLTEQDAADCLRCVCDHLRPGGVFVLGLHLTEYEDRDPALERWRVQRDGLDVICTIRSWPADVPRRIERVRSRIVVRSAEHDVPKRYETNWEFRTYDTPQLRALLRTEPRLQHVATYTFHHDMDRPTSIDGEDLGVVLVLRRED